MLRKLYSALILFLILCLAAGCATPPAANTPLPRVEATLTARPPKPTRPQPTEKPTRPPLPTKTPQAAKPSLTPQPAQPTLTQKPSDNVNLGRKFEGVFARGLICKGGRIWYLGGAGLGMLDPETMTASEFPIDNLVGGPWSAGDWIWTYEYLNDNEHTGGFLVGRDPKTGQIEKYLDMMQNLEWETFLLGMGEVGSEYWVSDDAVRALLIDKTSGKSVGEATLPEVAHLIVDDGNKIWFAGDTLFVMDKSTQQFSYVLESYVTGLDTDNSNMWVMTIDSGLFKVDLATYSWDQIPISENAWAGCYDGSSYWYADAFEETVQEMILP